MAKRILFLTLYYPPDLAAGSFRSQALVESLDSKLELDDEVDVFTAQPNRYESYGENTKTFEQHGYINIYRSRLPQHNSRISGQVRAFLIYAWAALQFVKDRDYDLVIATSSRLMTGVLGTWIAMRKGAKLYLDIRDIFVETLDGVFPGVLFWPLRRLFGALERWALKRADRVNLVSQGFLGYFQSHYGQQEYRFFTNGVDAVFSDGFVFDFEKKSNITSKLPINIVYAGNIGAGQGLENIIPELSLALSGIAKFTIVGDGATRQKLYDACQLISADVTFLEPVAREDIPEIYQSADVLFLHLNDITAFKRVLPSKLFEYAATGKPILAGVSGYCHEFIRANVSGAAVFEPCNVKQAIEAFENIDLSDVDRRDFIDQFSRKKIMDEMAVDILSVIKD